MILAETALRTPIAASFGGNVSETDQHSVTAGDLTVWPTACSPAASPVMSDDDRRRLSGSEPDHG